MPREWFLFNRKARTDMTPKVRMMRLLLGLGGLLAVAAPSSAMAHDNLGGDELAATNWMLIGAIAVIVMGLLAGIWALRDGQFTNIEDIKYRMIDLSEDYDAVMAEADAREERTLEERTAASRPDVRQPSDQPAITPAGKQAVAIDHTA